VDDREVGMTEVHPLRLPGLRQGGCQALHWGVLGAAFSVALTAGGTGDGGTTASPAPQPTMSAMPAASVSATAAGTDLSAILTRAINEERSAKATYDNVITALGAVAPFPAISSAEAMHVAELERVASVHGLVLPAGPVEGRPAPATLVEACRMGRAAEQADIALYDELLPQVQTQPDVVQVLTNLRTASQDRHLPAFRRCD
jgi:hypothetical protein